MVISISDICGDDIISRDAGKKVRDYLLAHWGEDKLEIKLGVDVIGSISFFDEAFGLLIKRGEKDPQEIIRKIKFLDIGQHDRKLINHIFKTRIEEAKKLA
jgi:hypothetical protein